MVRTIVNVPNDPNVPNDSGHTRANVGLDLYNLFNSSAVLSYNQTFVPNGQWLQPLLVLTPRFVKFTAQFDF